MVDHSGTDLKLVESLEKQHVLKHMQWSPKSWLLLQLLPDQMDTHTLFILARLQGAPECEYMLRLLVLPELSHLTSHITLMLLLEPKLHELSLGVLIRDVLNDLELFSF